MTSTTTPPAWSLSAVASQRWLRIAASVFAVIVAFAIALILAAALIDWNALRGPVAGVASRMTHRTIAIRGALDVDVLSATPGAHVEGLVIGPSAAYGGVEPLAEVAAADVRVRFWPLLLGRLEIASLDVHGVTVRARRRADGVSNWSSADRETPLRLPLIQRLSLEDGRLDLVDARRGLSIDAKMSTAEELGQAGAIGRFSLVGAGALNGRKLTLMFSGAPLVNVRRDRPYPFVLETQMGATQLVVDGAIARPFDLTHASGQARASGPDLADLYYLTGAALPNSPPYRLESAFTRTGSRIALTAVKGRIGDSDVSGALTADKPAGGRLRVTGEITSRSLDFDDLLTILGGAPDTRETASQVQRAVARDLATTERWLPEATLDLSRVRNMDADVTFAAKKVRADRLAIRAMNGRVTLERGLLRIEPLRVDLAPGRVVGFVQIDARAQGAPHVDVDMRLSGARLESILTAGKTNPAIIGPVRGRAQLTGRGLSVRTAAADADGRITFYAPAGAVRSAFAELTGINIARGLGLLVTGDQSKVDLRCAVADFNVRDGQARGATILADTDTMRIGGAGGFSLRDETLDLRLRGEPKAPRLIRLAAPIRLRGHFRAPEVGVDTRGLLGQGGAAAALSALLAPAAAVLAFIDPGDADDADCAKLIAAAETARPTASMRK